MRIFFKTAEVLTPAMERTTHIPLAEEGWMLTSGSMVEHFRVMRPLGRGAMAQVYLARDTKLGRKVALKVVHPEALGDQNAVDRFISEARITARFNHPHIVTIHAVGEEAGRPFVALEYLEGQSLRGRLDQEHPSATEILRIGLAVVKALREAHFNGILHRDLKPENVMLTRDGRLRVLDFGLAKGIESSDSAMDDTQPLNLVALDQAGDRDIFVSNESGIRGTPLYMAPEQWKGKETEGTTDIWALGVMLYEMVAGHRPFEAQSYNEQAIMVCTDPGPPPFEEGLAVLPALKELIFSCLQKDPDQRPSASQVAMHLEEMLSQNRGKAPKGESPFRGLLPFREQHHHLYFGRTSEIAAAVERLRDEPVLAVIGPSGAGKSSFVQAGVIPWLREKGPLEVIQLRPGRHPFLSLAARIISAREQGLEGPFGATLSSAKMRPVPETLTGEKEKPQAIEELAQQLRESPSFLNVVLQKLADHQQSSVLLFVDQLEELYTLVDDDQRRQRFMEAISTASDDPQMPVRVIFTLREEFISRLVGGPTVRDAVRHIAVLGAVSPQAIEEILTEPVKAAGYTYDDPSLVQEMIEEVQGELSCLPLLQFTGQMLWERRDRTNRLLLRAAYQSLGGVVGALAKHADGVLAGLSSAELNSARTILLRMVTVEGTRQVLPRSRVLAGLDQLATGVLDHLVEARLITVKQSEREGEAELELVHESLFSAWGRLQRWVEESREELIILAEAEQAAELWVKRGSRREEVWRGGSLRDALKIMDRKGADLPETVIRFLEAGQEYERRRIRRRRKWAAMAISAMAVVAIGAIIAAVVLFRQKHHVEEQRKFSELQRAESQREGARAAWRWGDMLEARAKLRGSLEISDSVLSRLLWWRLSEDPLIWKKTLGSIIYSVDFSPDGETLAVSSTDSSVYLFDTRLHRVQGILRQHKDQVFGVAFAPDGKTLASGGWDGETWIWNLETKERRRVKGIHHNGVYGIAFSPDGRILATGGKDHMIRLWDVRTGNPLRVLAGHDSVVIGVAFSPDGRQLASGSVDTTVRLWDVATGAHVRSFKGHKKQVWGIRFSPDGALLASGSYDSTARIWRVETGQLVHILNGHKDVVRGVDFSPDGKVLATASNDKTIRLWSVETGALNRVLHGHEDVVYSVRFSPDGRTLASGSYDKSLRVWSADPKLWVREPRGPANPVYGVAFSPEEHVVATGGADGKVRIWDVSSGQLLRQIAGHSGAIYAVVFSPDGNWMATASDDKSVRLFNADTGVLKHIFFGHTGPVWSVKFSPDGQTLASSSEDQSIRLWGVSDGLLKGVLSGHTLAVRGLAFSPDGQTLVSGGADRRVLIWDWKAGKKLREWTNFSAQIYGVAFSPDGRSLVTGSEDRYLQIWDFKRGTLQFAAKNPARIYWLDVHPDGEQIGVSGSDGIARLWNIKEKTFAPLKGHRGEVNNFVFSSSGRLAATAADDGMIRIWEVDSHRPFWRAPVLLTAPPRLYSHQGWALLDSTARPKASPVVGRKRWRAEVEANAKFADEGPQGSGRLCLITYDDRLELWRRDQDKRLFSRRIPDLQRVQAFAQGCAILAGGRIEIYNKKGQAQVLVDRNSTALAASGNELLVAAGRQVRVLSAAGRVQRTYQADIDITALTHGSGWLVMGYRDGNIDLISTATGHKIHSYSFEEVPSSPVERLLIGAKNTLVVGFANGQIGIWNLKTGRNLVQSRLHGPVVHLVAERGRIYAATELGDHLVWDLRVLQMSYCELLRKIWKRVPVVWEGGLPVLKAPPLTHPCAQRR